MPISYAGVDLLLEDPAGQARRWIDSYLTVEGMNLFGEPTGLAGNRSNPRSGAKQFTALPTPNYPALPTPKLNSLYWPTGASRWSYGLFLIDFAGLQNIYTALNDDGRDHRGNPALLKIYDSNVNPDTIPGFWMYLLPARRVSAFDGQGHNGLWLLPLVDQRYWWQYLQFDGVTDSWDALIASCKETCLLDTAWDDDSIAQEYGLPHPGEMGRVGDSVAMMLDAAAHCVGKRFVMDTHWNGGETRQTGILKQFSAAESTLNSNITAAGSSGIVAGGEFSGNNISMVRAEKVSVVFPNADRDAEGDIKEAALGGAVTGTLKTFHETADTGTTDSGWRQSLTNRIAADLAGWTKRIYDFTLAGIFDWRPTGYDNYIEFKVGHRLRGRKYQMQTRACSMPYNFGVENLCHAQSSSSSSSQSSSSESSSSTSSPSSSSSSSCPCGQTVWQFDGEGWNVIFTDCEATYTRPTFPPDPAIGQQLVACCACPSSSSSTSMSSAVSSSPSSSSSSSASSVSSSAASSGTSSQSGGSVPPGSSSGASSGSSSMSSSSTSECPCGIRVWMYDGESWVELFSDCPGTRPTFPENPVEGQFVADCCECSSSSSSSSLSSSSSSGQSSATSGSGASSGTSSSGAPSSSSGGCNSCFTGICASDISGYNAGSQQALIHDASGCLRWIDIGQCATSSSSASG